jgi:tetratricopeptide (TPR) repeat protein
MRPKALNAAVRALELDPSLAEAHDALADIKLVDGDLKEAELEFKRALALNPSYAGAHSHLAGLLLAIGRRDEAIAENRTSRELDPYSAPYATLSGMVLFMAGLYDRALEEERAALALDPQHERAHFWLGYVYEQQGRYKDAIAEYEKVLPHDSHCNFLAALGRSLFLAGDSKGADEVRRKIEHSSEKDWVWPYDAALFYTAFGDKDRAFTWLEKDHKEHYGWTLFLNVDPRLSPLRSDPRFDNLTKRVGLPVSESR